MGLGTQLIHWNPEFCELLGERGYRVIRFDNRDVGHSTTLDAPPPEPHRDAARAPRAASPTRLDDMADDAVGLLDRARDRARRTSSASRWAG